MHALGPWVSAVLHCTELFSYARLAHQWEMAREVQQGLSREQAILHGRCVFRIFQLRRTPSAVVKVQTGIWERARLRQKQER